MKRIMDAEAAAIRDIAITDAFEDGVQLLNAIQDVFLDDAITIA